MSPLEFFLSYSLYYNNPFIDEYELDYEKDDSNYHIIDGEEGDYGIIKYFHNNIHICDYVNCGGDSDYYEYTEEGQKHFKELALKIFNAHLETI